jgi:N-acylneuraminate cytidylyltransferase
VSRLCIIPARGGSKRIPRKNIKLFLGKPIIAYSIEAALESGLFDEVMVSTDDEEIAEVGKRYGAIVPFIRSKECAGDFASTLDVIQEVSSEYNRIGNYFSEIVCLYATAPFVTVELLVKASRVLSESRCDCVFPILRYGYPVQRSLRKTEEGKIEIRYPEHLASRSQDLEPVFHDTGMFYFFIPENVLDKQTLWTDNTVGIEVSDLEAHDIDTPQDWEIAEFKYGYLHGKKI